MTHLLNCNKVVQIIEVLILPQFFSLRDISGSKEAHVREPRVLMLNKDLNRGEIWWAVVVDEPGYVAVLVGIDAVSLTTVLCFLKVN